MAISWITAFKVIPWTKVLEAAPTIVHGAGKLLDKVAERRSTAPPPSDARLESLEAQVAQLRSEALAATELVKSLAEQNARLVEAIEILRVRTRLLLASGAVLALALAALFALLYFKT